MKRKESIKMKPFRMFARSIRDAFKSVFRNFSLSLASISCISITLIIVAVALLASLNVNNFTKIIKEDVTIVVFVDREVTESGINTIRTELDKIDNISSIEYKSKKELLEEMRTSSSILDSTMKEWDEDENPLKDTFQIKVEDIEKISTTASSIEKIEGVDSVNYGETMVNKFLSAFKIIEKGTILAVILLIVVTVFLIINTIKLTIFSRKREISIMRLVGASNFSIKMPFLIEGMVLGLIGSILPILIVIYGYYALYRHFGGQLYSPLIKLITPEPFIYIVSLVILIIGIVVGMIGSLRAVRKYLKV
jgi:cell division transport system permease protein